MNRTTAFAIASLALASGTFAGPLTPPVGPVASTYKTLTEVEPRIAINATNTPGDADSVYKITLPGSYYLSQNLVGAVGKRSIEIIASGVTLDLNGFEISGVTGSLAGIASTVNGLRDIRVLNGSLRDCGGAGIDFATNLVNSAILTHLRASGNGAGGLLAGYRANVSECSAYSNTGMGITVGAESVIHACMAASNTQDGIAGGTSCSVTNCSSNTNGNAGISFTGSSITNCVANANTGNGINNSGGGTVHACAADDNNLNGFNVGAGTISNCTARVNTLNGIFVSDSSIVLNNACSANGLSSGNGAGILVFGTANRIEGNNCYFADRGIHVGGIGNVIVRNSCKGNNVNWQISAGNVVGPILDRTVPASAAINGNSGPSSLGTTDANANFTF
jgi:hypothetical protein